MGLLARLTVLLAVASPSLVAAETAESPASVSPRITSIRFSGNGCPQDPKHTGGLNDATFTYNHFELSIPGGNQTLNCQVHVQASGVGSGWQMALSRNRVKGHVVLGPGTSLTHYTTVYYSQDASRTVRSPGGLLFFLVFQEEVFRLLTKWENRGPSRGRSRTTGARPSTKR